MAAYTNNFNVENFIILSVVVMVGILILAIKRK